MMIVNYISIFIPVSSEGGKTNTMSVSEETKSRQILLILTAFSAALVIASFFAGNIGELIPGFIRINTSPSQFTMDYFKLGGLGAAFLNTGLVGFCCCGLLYFTKAKCTGLSVAAYWLNVGFSTFGMTVVTLFPFFIGTFVYSRIKKVSFGSVANLAMFSTALAPFAGELLFRYPALETRGFTFGGLIGALLLGLIVGCFMPALCAHAPNFHKGYDLYNAGPAAGFLAFAVFCVLFKAPGIEVPTNTDLGDGHRLFVNIFFLLVFAACGVAAYLMDKNAFSDYKELFRGDGYKTDYTAKYGIPATLANMCVYGLFILLYYNVVHGITFVDGAMTFTGAKFTGATMGAIMCMYAFVANGAQPRTVFPIMVGYVIASLLPLLVCVAGLTEAPNWTLTTQAMLVGLCFASGLAPVSGRFGFWPGVLAGALHAVLVMNVPLWHGGFCLYNGGFTCGIVAFILVPQFESFFGTKEERAAKKRG